jgi:drug/metabolite transporter (DMT)-like permease
MGAMKAGASTGSRTSGGSFLLVAAAAALWGTDALFRRGLALELPATAVVLVEHALLVVFTLPLLVRAVPRLRRLTGRDWAALLLVGVGASATATTLFTAAFALGDPTTPLLLQKLQPLIAVAGARLLLGERLLPRFGVYLACALAGAWLVAFPDPGQARVAAALPAVLALGAAALWGLGTVLGRHLVGVLAPRDLTALRFAVGLPASALLAGTLDGWSWTAGIDAGDGVALVLLALVPGLLSLWLYYRGLAGTPAAAATLAELAFPVAAVLVGYAVFDQVLTATQWLGTLVLVATITTMGLAGTRRPEALGVTPPPVLATRSP